MSAAEGQGHSPHRGDTLTVDLADLAARLAVHQLVPLGGFHADNDPDLPAGTRTVVLIGPGGQGYWPHVQAEADWTQPDPIDRWSRRVIGRIACDLGAKALFPFGGPPWHPFHRWALRSGQAWESPVRLLVHAAQGLMVSYRGALALRDRIDLPQAARQPCIGCPAPCLTVCPVEALTGAGYDVPRCHAYLDTAAGSDCMEQGCVVRRACPVSARHARMAEHSAYHMRQFHR